MPMTLFASAPTASAHRKTLADWVLGPHLMQRRAVKRLLLVSHAYAVIWAMVAFSVEIGYTPANAWWLIIYGVIGQSLFYVILRSGWTLQFEDPLYCYPQLLFGIGACIIGYVLIPYGQGPALQVLVVLFVYDLHRLTPRQISVASTLAVILLALAALTMWAKHLNNADLLLQAINIGMAVSLVPMVSIIGRAVRRVHMVQLDQKTQLDNVLVHLKNLSQRDALTNAINRRHMMELLDEESKRQNRTGQPFCVAMLDIDHFKRINDGFGHAVGDIVLQQITQLIHQQLRQADVLARWGGEEFLLMMPATTTAEAAVLVNRLRECIGQHDWNQHATGLQVSFSAGLTQHQLHHDLDQTIELADSALYRAKAQGRNRVEHV